MSLLKSELVTDAIYPYFKDKPSLDSLLFHDAMAAHALLKAMDELITTDPSLRKRIESVAKKQLMEWRV